MKYKRRIVPKYLIIVSLLFIFTIIWVILMCSYSNVNVELNGPLYVKTVVNEEYNDLGFKLTDNNTIINIKDFKTNSTLDITKIGKYTYSYEINYKNHKYNIKRNVEVIDNIPPVIEVKNDYVIKDYCTNNITNTLDYKVIDNYDGDITDNIIINEIDDKYVLSSVDSSENLSVIEIPIKYGDKPKESLKLKGSKTINVKLNGTYKEQGATYNSGCSVQKKANIKVEGNVDTTKVGTYTIKYSYNNLSVTRKVVVYEPKVNETPTGNKVIYLTFDDGPSKHTSRLLDILDKYNVKATFFVVGNYTSLIKEEYQRGHTIGVHSLTHEWSIYKSLDSYLADFNKMNDIIEKQTGSRSTIFRFPGGSSNAVSRKYATGIVKKIADYMTDAGYVYFDWNVSAGDASSNTGEDVYRNVVNGVKNCTKCVILMHDSKKKTVDQVERIITTFMKRGYTFDTLSTEGPIVHHKIKN